MQVVVITNTVIEILGNIYQFRKTVLLKTTQNISPCEGFSLEIIINSVQKDRGLTLIA